jgi:hypothetical protein
MRTSNIKRGTGRLAIALGVLIAQSAALAFYNPQAGRWLNRDPLSEAGSVVAGGRDVESETTEEDHLQRLVRSDPVNHYDLLGLQCCNCSLADKDSVAIYMGLSYNLRTKRSGNEIGGYLCCSGGRVHAGTVVEGKGGRLPITKSVCADEDKVVGAWHTHPKGKPRQNPPPKPGHGTGSPDLD